eukprot:gene9471-biopygen3720
MVASLCSLVCIYCIAPWSMAASLCSPVRIDCIAPWRAVCNSECSLGRYSTTFIARVKRSDEQQRAIMIPIARTVHATACTSPCGVDGELPDGISIQYCGEARAKRRVIAYTA